MAEGEYTGNEPVAALGDTSKVESGVIFEVRAPLIPPNAQPIFDESLGAVIGYRVEATTGVYRLYDLDGKMIGMEEKGLETPLLDPLDLLFLGGAFRILGRGLLSRLTRQAPKVVAASAGRATASRLAVSIVGLMRMVFKGLAVGELKFTAATAARMMTAGRHVPLHILKLAIRYGKRTPDPQGVKGAFQYTITMFRNGKSYRLEVVLRESDNTVLHFLYK